MKIREIEVSFDFLDADDMERFEKETEKVKQECEIKGKQQLSCSEAIREECKIIDNFFNNVFGEGRAEKIFKGKSNIGDRIKAFEDIMKEKIEKQKGLQSTFDRYQPNREQRRYNQYHKGNRR